MTQPAPGPAWNPSGPVYCYRHPKREALIRCTRCDRPICTECQRPGSVGFQCPDDVAAGQRSQRQPRTVVGAPLRQTRPYVTGGLLAANVVVYVVTGLQSYRGLTGDQFDSPQHSLFNDWQLFPPSVHDGEYWRLLTSAFLHINPLHIAANMLALAVIGWPLEQALGRWRYLAVYLLAALGGSVAVYTFGSAGVPVVGASGGIFGLFAAALVMMRRLGLDPQWLVGAIVVNFVFTFSVHGISRLGHVGGFITGGLAALAIAGLPQLRQRFDVRRQAGGLLGLLALLLVITAIRTATGDFPG